MNIPYCLYPCHKFSWTECFESYILALAVWSSLQKYILDPSSSLYLWYNQENVGACKILLLSVTRTIQITPSIYQGSRKKHSIQVTWSSRQSAIKELCSFVTIEALRDPLLEVLGTIVLNPTAWHLSIVDAEWRVVKLLTSSHSNTCTYIFIDNNRFHLKVQEKNGCKFRVRKK